MTTEEIYQEMGAAFSAETGMEAAAGSDLEVRLYAVAAQIESLYIQAEWVGKQCFPQTSSGEYLDYHAEMRSLKRQGASYAEGVIRFYADTAPASELKIAAGTVCMTAGLVRFETINNGTLSAGSTYVDVHAKAVIAGNSGNVAAGSILTMAVAPVGISRCSNPTAFSGGAGKESDDELRARILQTFRRLPNGANAAYYEQQAKSFDEVAAAAAVPRSRGIGTVDVVISTLTGTPNKVLLEKLQAYFETRREISVDVVVKAPVLVSVDISVTVQAEDGYDVSQVRTDVKNAISAYYDGSRLGESVLRAKLGALIFGVGGVKNYSILLPAADVILNKMTLSQIGALTVSAS